MNEEYVYYARQGFLPEIEGLEVLVELELIAGEIGIMESLDDSGPIQQLKGLPYYPHLALIPCFVEPLPIGMMQQNNEELPFYYHLREGYVPVIKREYPIGIMIAREEDTPYYSHLKLVPFIENYEEEEYNFLEEEGSIQDFINRVIIGAAGSDKNFDSTKMEDSSNDKITNRFNEIWAQLLHHLNYNNGIRAKDFSKDYQSFVDYISSNIDLDEKKAGLFLDTYLKTKDKKHWNLSVDKIVNLYDTIFNFDDNNANAGYSFNSNEQWTLPNINNDNQTYLECRGNDKLLNVLNDMKELQFTLFEQINSTCLNLIMPKYKRELQIEDLNRNFWVIGQKLTLLYSNLFNDESPLPEFLSSILDEIIQLWENIFYLWVANSLLSQKQKNNDIKTIILPLSIEIEEDTTAREFLELIWNNNKVLMDKYNGTALVIIPEIKQNNYMKNYYSKAIYPGIIIYDNSLSLHENWLTIVPFKKTLIIDLKEQQITLATIFNQEDDNNE